MTELNLKHHSPMTQKPVLQAVLSLFDGISCGRIALERAGYEVRQYFASEIKPHAIKCTQSNYPNTIQLGSVLNVKGSDLPKIDLLIGGSPCK
jgi:site-specific DNA-cytosine methylase